MEGWVNGEVGRGTFFKYFFGGGEVNREVGRGPRFKYFFKFLDPSLIEERGRDKVYPKYQGTGCPFFIDFKCFNSWEVD